MSRIYISYSHHDSKYVEKLAAALSDLGQTPFYAEDSIAPGEKFHTVLSQNLREADVVAFILSKNSIESRYTMTEMGAALGYFEERGRPAVIPVLIDDSQIPAQVNHLQVLVALNGDPVDAAIAVASVAERMAGRAQAREEKKQEVRERVESNAAKFIETSLTELRKRESSYRRAAYAWYAVAYTSLGAGLAISLWRASIVTDHVSSWIRLAEFAAVGIIVLGLLAGTARFAFMLGKSFMVEALRNSDRIHAISFGEFYLRAFPEKIEWDQVKDAFQHWNIDKGSYFLSQSSADFDHELFKTAISIAEALSNAKRKKDE
ncbi:toll/interleukin-1 receptor domain-containing protein [Sorangium sp. So ce1151]|uniref:toll/interleukin-1 receptor domain-containing protein n=1 Tax=Sorangium sp. So ce1151 TaxID=3133332 RepID=UPI003F6485C1